MNISITRGLKEHVAEIAVLFDLYRQFYECTPDLELAKDYIQARIENNESTIFIAQHGDSVVGFTQLYQSFCSVDAVKIFILYDLYVDQRVRNAGVGAQLMNRASEYAKQQGASRLELQTAISNKPGQHLYEKLGYKKTLEDFYCYALEVQ